MIIHYIFNLSFCIARIVKSFVIASQTIYTLLFNVCITIHTTRLLVNIIFVYEEIFVLRRQYFALFGHILKAIISLMT